MMIQSISATRTAASGESAVPVAARASQGGQATVGQAMAGNAMRGFGERMLLASSAGDDLSSEIAAPTLQGPLPVLAAEQGHVLQAGGSVSQGNEAPQELTPEQWLLGMIDQQLAEIQARDAAQPGAAPAPQALPQATAATPDDLLSALPGQIQMTDAPLNAVPGDSLNIVKMAVQGRTVELNPVATAMPKPIVEMGVGQTLAAAVTSADAMPAASLDSLLEVAEPLEAGDPLTATVERGQSAPLQSADRALKLQAPEAKWGEQMLHALRENVDLQIQQKIQSATIRLDPPELGSMEILLNHESGRLNVQLSAANADVARLLQQTSDRLRQELVGQHFVQVNVQVGADGGGQQGQQRQRPVLAGEETPLAARPQEQAPERESARTRDVLVTV
ncbi:flagellar hook-length control protein FliK [Pseudomonas stutzeri]|uniref:flagellar hook-length control protein FliK n=1 Tax=Stutzerimonas stutzeri TaxID=316 RepID=UPI000C9BFCE5|nr:flagellar hook-length control protein FliK [Stutzerimonas stutzeri]MCQ4279426.1 flagellar hook-length control protein FliK [Stutzerimonas stutzeri]PNF72030.1 flagellar hook-length control protein FliK [Stutzerimonas stutzeri]